ncbi:hypothetical protein HK096_005444, partial [Nowakowskiella sp. JEL0078]
YYQQYYQQQGYAQPSATSEAVLPPGVSPSSVQSTSSATPSITETHAQQQAWNVYYQQMQQYQYAQQQYVANIASAGKPAPKCTEPAYIPVKLPSATPVTQISTTLQTPSTPTKSLNTQSTDSTGTGSSNFPLDLKNYVQKVFQSVPPGKKKEIEEHLKNLIARIDEKNARWSTDWKNMPLPAQCQIEEKPKQINPVATLKRKKTKMQLLSKKNPLKNDSDSDSDSSNISGLSQLDLRPSEVNRLEKRARRFESAPSTPKSSQLEVQRAREMAISAGAEGNPDVLEWDPDTIVGTCTVLEKRYLRLTSAPDPSTVRPIHILKQTLELLREKWGMEQNYTYICDQFKSLRQDLTVQRIKSDFTVRVYESHARIALEKKDLGEYNQCQAQLHELYKLGLPGHPDEFMAYRILYMVHTTNKTELHQILLSLTDSQKLEKSVRHALAIRMAVSLGDYHSLFNLYNKAPNMSAYMMDHFIDRERVKAMKIICRAYRPYVSLEFIAKELGFVLHEYFKAEKRAQSKKNDNTTKTKPESITEDTEQDMEMDSADEEIHDWENGIKSGISECKKWLETFGIEFISSEFLDTKAKLEAATMDLERVKELSAKLGIGGKGGKKNTINKERADVILELSNAKQEVARLKSLLDSSSLKERTLIIETRTSAPVFINRASIVDKVVDIKGQIH